MPSGKTNLVSTWEFQLLISVSVLAAAISFPLPSLRWISNTANINLMVYEGRCTVTSLFPSNTPLVLITMLPVSICFHGARLFLIQDVIVHTSVGARYGECSLCRTVVLQKSLERYKIDVHGSPTTCHHA